MANSPPDSDTHGDSGLEPNRDSTGTYPGTPRWVKVFGIAVIVLVLLVVVVMVAGGGEHGPGRHLPSGDAGGHILPAAHVGQRLWL